MIGHIILNVSNFEKSEAFYDTLFQSLKRHIRRKEEEEECVIKSYGYQKQDYAIMIQQRKDKKAQAFSRNVGLDHICLKAESRQHVEALYHIVQKFGYTITREPREYPEYSETYFAFYFRDPDNIPLEVVYSN